MAGVFGVVGVGELKDHEPCSIDEAVKLWTFTRIAGENNLPSFIGEAIAVGFQPEVF